MWNRFMNAERDARVALPTLALCILLGGCASGTATPEATPAASPPAADLPMTAKTAENNVAQAAYWGGIYETQPESRDATLNYGRSLRYSGNVQKAVKVLAGGVAAHADDGELLAEYGKALIAAGRTLEGRDYLAEANKRKPGNWTNLSAEGVAYDQLGDHANAQTRYEAALKASPNNPAILNNWALSYALIGDITSAERLLRQAVANPAAGVQVRQNLALVLGIQGDFVEARRYAAADLPPEVVEGNIDYIKAMIAGAAPSSPWSELESLDNETTP